MPTGRKTPTQLNSTQLQGLLTWTLLTAAYNTPGVKWTLLTAPYNTPGVKWTLLTAAYNTPGATTNMDITDCTEETNAHIC